MKELCVRCGKPTIYEQSTPIELRRYFIEGSGQLCGECFESLWPSIPSPINQASSKKSVVNKMRVTDADLRKITYESLMGEKPDDSDLPDDFKFPYDDAHDFHMGSCHLFTLALHERFGYEMWKVEKPDLHYFCRKGEYFIDACGYDKKLYHPNSGEDITDAEKVFVGNIDLDGEFDDEGLEFAKAVIEKNPDWYDCVTIEAPGYQFIISSRRT